MEKIVNTLLQAITIAKGRGLTAVEAANRARVGARAAKIALTQLEEDGRIVSIHGKYLTPAAAGYAVCEVVKLAETFGFVKEVDSDAEYFIPGRFLMGAIPGDIVVVKPMGGDSGRSPTGQVVKVAQYAQKPFSAVYTKGEQGDYLMPTSTKFSVPIPIRGHFAEAREGDRVLATISKRAKRHSENRADVLKVYGANESLDVLCQSVLDEVAVPVHFPADVLAEAKKIQTAGIAPADFNGRQDLRELPIFTIDGADTKDIDDAVSIEKTQTGFSLGVHIADVSHYVTPGSPLDREAYARGTSVYYANKVIPMLPKELSNGICSLNPQEDRLAFSALMDFDVTGNMKNYRFVKSVIRSRVKGVYSELNSIFDNTAGEEIVNKYAEISSCFPIMRELFSKLLENRFKRGAPDIDSSEAKIIIAPDGTVTDVVARQRGESERLIEEFMLCANEAAANLGRTRNIPFVYRIHDDPQPERIEILGEMLRELGLSSKGVKPGLQPSVMAAVVEEGKRGKYSHAVSYQVLRSMAKAVYSPEPKGHFGLVLKDYAHFTSPIRRYPDLMIHRIMSAYLSGKDVGKVKARFDKIVAPASVQSSATELKAMEIERRCEDIYKAQFMKDKVGQMFEGVISSIAPHGMYVELPNTVEGLVKLQDETLKGLKFIVRYKNRLTGEEYTVGDSVRVLLTKADVPAGQIDFEIIK